MARDVRNDIDKRGLTSRRRRSANSISDSNQTNRQQLQVCHDITADSPSIAPSIREPDTVGTIAPTLSPGSPNSHSRSNPAKYVPILNYGHSYSECACHHSAECPGIVDVERPSSDRKLDSSVSANWRRSSFFNYFFSSLSDYAVSCI